MRAFLVIVMCMMSLIAAVSLAATGWLLVSAASQPDTASGLTLATTALMPGAIGTVALGSIAVAIAVISSARDTIAAINRGTEVALNEARHAAHHLR